MEKTVKGATKIKLAAPKSKYVEPILAATRGGDSGVADVFRTLQLRLRDSTWTIVFKSLIIVHLMIREGAADVTLRYVAESPKRIAISTFTEVQTQGVSIRRYYEYLLERVKAYRDTKTDFVRSGAGKMKGLTVNKGLLRQTEIVQEQIKQLLRCDFLSSSDPDNEISITGFRLLTLDLLELFKVMNEGTINVLEHYFEMSKPDAQRALNIYKTFGRQTDQVVQYLSLAKQYELYTKLEVPRLKHAPTTLTSSLEDYLNDPDFEINRRQYLAQQEAKRTGKPIPKSQPTPAPFDRPVASSTNTAPTPAATRQIQPKGPAPDLIDFFESIEQNQQPMAQPNVAPQPNFTGGLAPQQLPQYQPSPQYQQPTQYQQPQIQAQQTAYNPFLQGYQQPQSQPQPQPQASQAQPLQADFTGAGFGGFGPQPTASNSASVFGFQPQQLSSIPQDTVVTFQQAQPPPTQQPLQAQPTSTNPFRQSTMIPQNTNPFAQSAPVAAQQGLSPASPQSLQPQMTGTNPFAKNRSPPPVSSPISVNVTGSTNPFRQSQFVSQATGQGWQHSTQGTLAGFDMNNVETVPIFPRPGHD